MASSRVLCILKTFIYFIQVRMLSAARCWVLWSIGIQFFLHPTLFLLLMSHGPVTILNVVLSVCDVNFPLLILSLLLLFRLLATVNLGLMLWCPILWLRLLRWTAWGCSESWPWLCWFCLEAAVSTAASYSWWSIWGSIPRLTCCMTWLPRHLEHLSTVLCSPMKTWWELWY